MVENSVRLVPSFNPAQGFLHLSQRLLYTGDPHIQMVRHQDEFDGNKEHTGFEQHIVRELCEKERRHKEDKCHRERDQRSGIKIMDELLHKQFEWGGPCLRLRVVAVSRSNCHRSRQMANGRERGFYRKNSQARSRLGLRRPGLLLSPKYMLSKWARLVGLRRKTNRLPINLKNLRIISGSKISPGNLRSQDGKESSLLIGSVEQNPSVDIVSVLRQNEQNGQN